MFDLHGDRIEHVEPHEFGLVLGGEHRLWLKLLNLTFGSPQTLKIWLDRMFFSKSPMSRSGVAWT